MTEEKAISSENLKSSEEQQLKKSLEEVTEKNQALLETLENLQLSQKLQDTTAYRMTLIQLIETSLNQQERIIKGLSSIAQQIFDMNQALLSDKGIEAETE